MLFFQEQVDLCCFALCDFRIYIWVIPRLSFISLKRLHQRFRFRQKLIFEKKSDLCRFSGTPSNSYLHRLNTIKRHHTMKFREQGTTLLETITSLEITTWKNLPNSILLTKKKNIKIYRIIGLEMFQSYWNKVVKYWNGWKTIKNMNNLEKFSRKRCN